MKQKYEGKDLQSLVELGREQGYLTFDQVNGFLPRDVTSPTDLRSALESFQDMDIKVLDDVPADGAEGELEAEVKEEPDEGDAAAPAADSISESSDPVRLYLKEMGNFQLLSREQEVEIAKRIKAGENEVEEEVLRSPVTLDLVIEMGARVEAGEADLRDIFEKNEEPTDDDEERGPEANEEQLKQLFTATTKLKTLQRQIGDLEEKLKERPKSILKAKLEKSQLRLKESVTRELHALELSRHLQEAVIGEMRHLLQEARDAQTLIQRYEQATGHSKSQLLRAAGEAEDRRHVLKINGSRENLLDIAARIKEAQKTVKEVERRTIRIPVHMAEIVNKLLRVTRLLVQRLGREPSPEEIAEQMGMPLDKVQKALKLVKEPISLETPIGDEEQSSLGDFVEDELAPSPVEAAVRGNLGELTRKVLATLTPREEQILRIRFGIGRQTDYTLEEVGKQFAVTRERIRQIEARALRKLRQTGRSHNLEGFMERETRRNTIRLTAASRVV